MLVDQTVICLLFWTPPLGESSDVESEEEDDEGSSTSQDDKEAADSGKTEKPDTKAPNQNKAKPRDDLDMYEKFFPELFEFQVSSQIITLYT